MAGILKRVLQGYVLAGGGALKNWVEIGLRQGKCGRIVSCANRLGRRGLVIRIFENSYGS